MKTNTTKKIFMTDKKRDLIFYILFIAFPVLQFCIFYIGVNFNSILMAFQTYSRADGTYSWYGINNFKEIFNDFATDSTLQLALKNSVLVYLIGLAVSVPLALLFSFYIYKNRAGSTFFRVLLYMPSIISAISLVAIFSNIVDRVIPEIINKTFKTNMWGLLANPDTQFGTLLFYTIFVSFGMNVLLYVDSMKSIDPEIVEAASLDGITVFGEFIHISLPMIYPTIITFVTVGLVGIFTNQMNLFSFFGRTARTDVYTLGYYMYKETHFATEKDYFDIYTRLAALGLMMTMVAAPLTLGVRKVLKKLGPSVD